jgi:adenylate cyclase
MLYVTIANSRQNSRLQHAQGPLEFGRGPRRDVERLIVEDRYTSRDQLRIEELPDGRLRVANLGGQTAISTGKVLATGEECEVELPVRISFGYTTLDVLSPPERGAGDSLLRTIDVPLGQERAAAHAQTIGQMGESPSAPTLARWFERLLAVQRAVVGSSEFYVETAKAVVELVGLDRGLIMLRSGKEWILEAAHPAESARREVSHRVLAQVVAEGRTFYESFEVDNCSQSLQGVEAVVASPVFDARQEVVGVVYGTRDLRSAALQRRGIQPLEAQFVQLLAGAVSAGLARMQGEAEAARTRVQFEQFFSAELAGALERDPTLLEGQEREITVLFGDLRGFSGLSEIVGARRTYALLGDVMDSFTSCIMEHAGVVIDYYGDGLAAMWNAPADQADHVERACRAALAILGELPTLSASWADSVSKPLRIGIGINTGSAQVGNAGSQRRLKYGPRGHTVNLASRIEAATKILGVSCLISAFSERQLPEPLARRRICCATLSGIVEPIDLYELVEAPGDQWRALRDGYEQALLHFEAGRFADCLKICAELAGGVGKVDIPTTLLAQRASAQLSAGGDFQPYFRLDVKG